MRSTAITQASGGVLLDRNIALELVYATEAAAISAQPWIGGGDKNAADAAAVDAMRACLSTVDIAGRIVTQHSQSRIGLGLAAIGRPAYITVGRAADLGDPSQRTTSEMQDRAHRLLDAAWDAGVRYFDAARSYGHAENFLGSWLAAHPGRGREATVGSKWGYKYVGRWRIDAESCSKPSGHSHCRLLAPPLISTSSTP